MQLCRSDVEIVGQKCSSRGREPTDSKVQKVLNWPPPQNVTDVRGFLGLCGTVRIWIKDYSLIARPLVDLTRKRVECRWGEAQEEAFQRLKELVTSTPALRPIDYHCERPVVLSVDSSKYGIGFILSQLDEQGRKVPARYGSLPLNSVQANYAQSKLELYGLMRALWEYRIFILGVENLIVEVDAASIKGMLNRPHIQGSPMNRWIEAILTFDFELVHVPGERHKGPDAVSRRGFTPEEEAAGLVPSTWIDDVALLVQTEKKEEKQIVETTGTQVLLSMKGGVGEGARPNHAISCDTQSTRGDDKEREEQVCTAGRTILYPRFEHVQEAERNASTKGDIPSSTEKGNSGAIT